MRVGVRAPGQQRIYAVGAYYPGLTELVIGQARDKAQVASILRQTETGKAGFIASSKNKTRKQTVVLSESDVYLSSHWRPFGEQTVALSGEQSITTKAGTWSF